MAAYSFTIELTSDAEPGTGLGTNVIDDLTPRDHWGRPVIRASHVKGLMRDALREIIGSLGWDDAIEKRVFGEGDDKESGIESAMRLSDAVAADGVPTSLITRTAVDPEFGVAYDKSLRTTEAIPVGTVFKGEVHCDASDHSAEALAWRLSLLSIAAIGAGRSRGSGACVVEIDGEHRSPGTLLRELHGQRNRWTGRETETAPVRQKGPSSASVVLRLVFQAHTPICCPEIPNIANVNVIESGFSIPASAVQGLILNRINARDQGLATGVFHSPGFRVWPLHPCRTATPEGGAPPLTLPVPIRVSLTHRVAKFNLAEVSPAEHVYDTSYDMTQPEAMQHVPFKSADGVLLCDADGVRLWKASKMPHVITAHGVIRGTPVNQEGVAEDEPETGNRRNLFTVNAMAPMVWQGLAVLPEDAAEFFQESLQRDRWVAFGKSRSVRGLGVLRATKVEGSPLEWQTPAGAGRTVLIAQSPLWLQDQTSQAQQADEELMRLAQGWVAGNRLPAVERVWANAGIRFGWSRHHTQPGRAGRQAAQRVMLPGSVIALSERVDGAALAEALKSGVGEGRERGFGAVSVHPGPATLPYEPPSYPRHVSATGDRHAATRRVLDIPRHKVRLPSPSQLRALQQQLLTAPPGQERDVARAYLKHQTERTSRIWYVWEPIYSEMDELLKTYAPQDVAAALEVLADLAIVDQRDEEDN